MKPIKFTWGYDETYHRYICKVNTMIMAGFTKWDKELIPFCLFYVPESEKISRFCTVEEMKSIIENMIDKWFKEVCGDDKNRDR